LLAAYHATASHSGAQASLDAGAQRPKTGQIYGFLSSRRERIPSITAPGDGTRRQRRTLKRRVGDAASVPSPNCPCGHCAKDTAMSLLIGALVTFLVVILVLYLVNMLPVDGRTKQIVRVVVIIIGVLSLVKYLGVWI
jgi:hypothetical protein